MSKDTPSRSLMPTGFDPSAVTKQEVRSRQELAKFREERAKRKQPKRIIFACDATGSRVHAWEMAKAIQARMIESAMQYGNVELKIVAYRDRYADPDDFVEASSWSQDKQYLKKYMSGVSCHGGGGNDGESADAALKLALDEEVPLSAVIVVGDEPVVPKDRPGAYKFASQLGERGVPVFTFQEGENPETESDFREIARRSGGVFDRFTNSSEVDFGDRLSVTAVFATGGEKAVDDFIKKHASGGRLISPGAKLLAKQLIEKKN